MKNFIYLITGGQRSGKSTKAEKLALSLSPTPVYLATAHIWDDEFRERVARHQARRGPNWTNIEEELYPSHHDVNGKVVLIDCCTLWATNFFFRDSKGEELPDVDKTLAELKDEFDRFISQDATFIFVTNEIGLGGVSANAVQRRFTDLMGWFNQYIAQKADEVIMMVSGVAMKIKEPQPLTCPSGILSPRGEEEVTNDPSKESSQAIKGNFSLAPWGEGVRRTGEGLGGRGRLALALQSKIDNLNKPKGSLGRLESLALQIGLIQHTLSPKLTHPCHILFGGDHGIEREGVSFSPREVTWQQMINYGKGGGGVNMFCRQHGFKLLVVDAGVDYDFPAEKYPHIIQRKVGYGTRNFLHEAAMSKDEFDRCLTIGTEMVDKCHDEGCNIICFGEMGIGNTSPSSILMHLFLGIPLTECVGAGSGLNLEGVKHKYEVLKTSVDNYLATLPQNHDAAYTIRYFFGFEMACAVGGMLRAAELGMIILVDGFIMSACILAASRLNKNVMDYAIFGHCGDEGGHKLMLDAMNAKPLLHLDMRLGEGTGALCAYPIVQSAVNMINEMDNFAHAEITKYF